MKFIELTKAVVDRCGYYGSRYLPLNWEFNKHRAEGFFSSWKLAEAVLPIMQRNALNPYDVRVKAVQLKRTYVTQGLTIPAWLQELTA